MKLYDKSGVYLLHFDIPFKHAKHYLGFAKDIDRRVLQHKAKDTRVGFMHHVVDAGINFNLVRIWPGANRLRERQLKKQGGASRLCPVCKTL